MSKAKMRRSFNEDERKSHGMMDYNGATERKNIYGNNICMNLL